MGLSVIDALSTLSTVDYQAIGLTDFGRPEGFLERQVPRWLGELDAYAQLDNYPGTRLPVEFVSDWLTRNRPASGLTGIMHGDYHIANVMFALEGPGVAAIVDWEMCTIGDPLLDLGWLLATWPAYSSHSDVIGSALAVAGGLPPARELIRRYRRTHRIRCVVCRLVHGAGLFQARNHPGGHLRRGRARDSPPPMSGTDCTTPLPDCSPAHATSSTATERTHESRT